jgi:hypothetical protein
MYQRIREIRATKSIFAMDFWNDGEFTQGCIAGGWRYLHINAARATSSRALSSTTPTSFHRYGVAEGCALPVPKTAKIQENGQSTQTASGKNGKKLYNERKRKDRTG